MLSSKTAYCTKRVSLFRNSYKQKQSNIENHIAYLLDIFIAQLLIIGVDILLGSDCIYFGKSLFISKAYFCTIIPSLNLLWNAYESYEIP